MTDLTWTDEPPSEAGFYLTRVRHELGGWARSAAGVFSQNGSLKFMLVGSDDIYIPDTDDNRQWAGPIPEPTEH